MPLTSSTPTTTTSATVENSDAAVSGSSSSAAVASSSSSANSPSLANNNKSQNGDNNNNTTSSTTMSQKKQAPPSAANIATLNPPTDQTQSTATLTTGASGSMIPPRSEHILLTLMYQFETLSQAIIDNFAYEKNSKCKRVLNVTAEQASSAGGGASSRVSQSQHDASSLESGPGALDLSSISSRSSASASTAHESSSHAHQDRSLSSRAAGAISQRFHHHSTHSALTNTSLSSTHSSLSSSLKSALADVHSYATGGSERFSPLLIHSAQRRVLQSDQIENDVRTVIYSSITLADQSLPSPGPPPLTNVSSNAACTTAAPPSPLKSSFSFSDFLSPTRAEMNSFSSVNTSSVTTSTATSLASTLKNSLRRTNSGILDVFSSSSSSPHHNNSNVTALGSGHDWSIFSVNQKSSNAFLYLIETFSRLSKHSPNAVVEALLEWRVQFDCSPPQHILKKIQKSLKKEKKKQQKEQAYVRLFQERKELAVNYIFLYVLLHIFQLFIQPPLSTHNTDRLLNLAFRHFSDARDNHKTANLNPLTESKEIVDDMYSQVVGILSITNFKQIANRFLDEIPYRFNTSIGRHEVVYYIRGMKYLRVRLGNQSSMEFLQRFCFDVLGKAKKSDIKNACCDAGQSILSPLGMEHEANDDRFFENTVKPLLLYCQKLNKKNKHIMHSYPFYSSILCLCPRKTFLDLFWSHVEALFRQYQKTDQKYKLMALDCLLHLYGYYMKIIHPNSVMAQNATGSAGAGVSTATTGSSPEKSQSEQSQREKAEKSLCADRVKRLASAIASQHKRTAPNTEQNEALYSAIVDLIVMIANANVQLAIDFILELFTTDYVCSENIYLGLRSLLNILDQSQIKKILMHSQLSALILSSSNAEDRPLWMINLLHRQRRYFGSLRGNSLDCSIPDLSVSGRNAYNHGTDTTRMQSPFNSIYSVKNNSVTPMGSPSSMMGNSLSILDVDIMKFQEPLSKALSNILKYCESANMSSSSGTNHKAHEDIFVLALTMIPKLIPNDYTSEGIAVLVTNCLIHPSKTIRQHSFQIIQQLMEFYPIIRAMLIEKLANLVLEDTKNIRLIEQLILLMKKWIRLTRSPLIIPLTYGVFKHVTKHKLHVSYIEVVGLVLLCNIDSRIRIAGVEVLKTLRDLALEATGASSDHEYILWDDQVSVYDILSQSSLQLIDMVFTNKTHTTSYTPFRDLISFLSTDKIDLLAKFLNRFSQTLTAYIPHTSSLAMLEIGGRIQDVDFDSKIHSEENDIVHQWLFYCEFSCGLNTRDTFDSLEYFRTKNKHIHSVRDVYNLILPFLRETTHLVSQAVEILGSVNPSMLDVLFDQLRAYEHDAFHHSAKSSQRRMRKKKDFLKIQISRVYSRLAENVDAFVLDEHEFLVPRFFAFLDQVLTYLTLTSNMYNTDLHPLRFHFFVIIEHLIRKYFLASSTIPLNMPQNKCYKMLLYVIRWSGFGQRDKKRRFEERKYIEQQKEKYKEDSAKQKLESHYKQHSDVLKIRSTAAMSSLMLLLRISGKQLRSIEQWSKMKRRSKRQAFSEWQNDDGATTRSQTRPSDPHPSSGGMDTLHTTSGSTSRKGITSSVYKKLSMLGSTTNILYADSGSEKAYQTVSKTSKEMVDQQILEWIDEALSSSKSFSHNTAVDCIINIVRHNPHFVPFCIDQCFNASSRISEGYFHALSVSLKQIDLGSTTDRPQKLLPLLIVLALFMMVSHNEQCRMDSIELLQLVSDYFFEEHSKGDNFAIMLSSTIQDANEMLQLKLSRKLSLNHPDFSASVLKEVYTRLEFISHYGQGMLLKALVPWISCMSLVEHDNKRRKSPRASDEKRQRKMKRVRQRTLEMMFEITKVYGSLFSNECEELWTALSEKTGHIQVMCSFVLNRLRQLDASSSKSKIQFSVAKQVVLYMLATDEKETISVLMQKVELQHLQQQQNSDEETLSAGDTVTHTLLDHEIVLVLLVETAYHSTVIGRYLATLIQHCFINMDHEINIVSESCKHLLANLLHQFVLRRLPHNGGTPEQVELLHKVRQLIEHALQHSARSIWSAQDSINLRSLYLTTKSTPIVQALVPEYISEHPRQRPVSEFPSLLGESSENFKKMRFLLLGVLDTFGERKELEEDWGREAILWATHCHSSLRMIARSFQIFRCLLPQTNYSHLQLILQTLVGYLKTYIQTNSGSILYVVLEIIETLRALVLSIDSHKLVLFSQLFWLSEGLLHSDVIELYNAGVCFMGDILTSFDMGSASVQNVILSTQPRNFRGIQPLLQKGFLHPQSKSIVIQLLNKLTLLNCDPRIVFQGHVSPSAGVSELEACQKGRLLQHILLLVPYLCVHLHPAAENCSASDGDGAGSPGGANSASTSGGSSSRDQSKCAHASLCSTMAARLALACDRCKLKKVARVFVRYSNGDYHHNEDKFLLELRRPLLDVFFPHYESIAYEIMETLLEVPEIEMQEAVLNLLHSWILHVDLRHSILYNQSRLISLVISLISQEELHEKATKVLDVAVRIACKDAECDLSLMSKSHDAPITLKSIPSGLQVPPYRSLPFVEAPGTATKTETVAVIDSLFEVEESDSTREQVNGLLLLLDHYQGAVDQKGASNSGKQQKREGSGDSSDSDHLTVDSTDDALDYHGMSRSFKMAPDEKLNQKIGLFDDLLKHEMSKMEGM